MMTATLLLFSLSAEAEPLPTPRIVEGNLPSPIPVVEIGPLGPVLPGYFLPDPYAAMKLYAFDRQNLPRPRVVFAPQPYYLFNGQPYRYLQVRPLDFSGTPQPSWR
jgi:hypothetical protein